MQFHFIFTITYKYYVKAIPNMAIRMVDKSCYCFLNRCISNLFSFFYYFIMNVDEEVNEDKKKSSITNKQTKKNNK